MLPKVLKLEQHQFACPSVWSGRLNTGMTVIFKHRLNYPYRGDWTVWASESRSKISFLTKESNDLKAIFDKFNGQYDFSTAEIIPMADPNEGYDLLGGLPHGF